MRQGPNQRRARPARSNGKRSFSHGPNRSFESNGPNVKLRGTAVQLYDKYLTLARDATSSDDRINAENYFQHAEHYFRVMTANAEQQRTETAQRAETAQHTEAGPRRESGGEGQRRGGGGEVPRRQGGGEVPRRGNGRDRTGADDKVSEPAVAGAAAGSGEPKGTPPDETVN